MSLNEKEHVGANGINFDNFGYGPWDAMDVDARVWEEGEYSLLYRKMVNFLDFVLNSDMAAFRVEVGSKGHKSVKVLSLKLANCYRNFNGIPNICFPGYACSPDVALFLDCYASHREISCCTFVNASWNVIDGLTEAEIFNDFVVYMRREAKRRGVKKSMRDWMYGLTKAQRDSIRAYLRTMPNKSTKLLCVRCELQYRTVAVSGDHVRLREFVGSVPARLVDTRAERGAPECAARIDMGRAMEDRDSFFDNPLGKDKDLFEHLIGRLWKTEQDKRGIIHHHALLVFDGQHVKDEFAALDRVAVRWKAVTHGAGYLHSTHHEKQKLIDEGRWHYGRIDCREGEMEALEAMIDDAAEYFTKDTQPVRFKPTPHARTLVKGWPRKPRQGGPGRPRKV